MKLGKFVIFKEKAGVISERPIWICFHSCWMYSNESFFGLFVTMFKQWQKDCNLVG
jgi:hypothetical protein